MTSYYVANRGVTSSLAPTYVGFYRVTDLVSRASAIANNSIVGRTVTTSQSLLNRDVQSTTTVAQGTLIAQYVQAVNEASQKYMQAYNRLQQALAAKPQTVAAPQSKPYTTYQPQHTSYPYQPGSQNIPSTNNNNVVYAPQVIKPAADGMVGLKGPKVDFSFFYDPKETNDQREDVTTLNIGINDYPVSPLQFCDKDVYYFCNRLLSVLRVPKKDVTVLSERLYDPKFDPTESNILSLLKQKVEQLKSGAKKLFVFQYSGHGTRDSLSKVIREDSDHCDTPGFEEAIKMGFKKRNESDGMAEAMVTRDMKKIYDFQLARLWKQVPKEAKVFFFKDACHSGENLPYQMDSTGEKFYNQTGDWSNSGTIMGISTSREQETSADGGITLTYPKGAGAGTAAAIAVLEKYHGLITIEGFVKEAQALLDKAGYKGQKICFFKSVPFSETDLVFPAENRELFRSFLEDMKKEAPEHIVRMMKEAF